MKKCLVLALLLVLSSPAVGFSGKSAIEQALEEKELGEVLAVETNLYNVNCLLVTLHDCNKFINRVQKNKKLLHALLSAKEAGVFVFLSSYFTILPNNSVMIDTKTSDQKIVEFLLGK